MSATERRRAAVLVTVVSNYAALVDQHTPMEAHRLVSLLRDTAVDVVRGYGGLVNQAMGEEIVSLFGVPSAHDDDDLRRGAGGAGASRANRGSRAESASGRDCASNRACMSGRSWRGVSTRGPAATTSSAPRPPWRRTWRQSPILRTC